MGSSLFLATSLGLLFGAFLIFGLIRMIPIADCSSSAFRVFPIETKKSGSFHFMDASAFLSVRTFTGFQRDPSLCCQIDPICPTESVPPELNKSGPLNERSQETELKKPVCFIGLSICISGIEGI